MVNAQQVPAIGIDGETTPYREPINHIPPIYHLHIPKTAGTSFRIWLADLFDIPQCCENYHAYELKDYQTQDLARYRFYAGHHGYDLLDRLGFWRNLYSVTTLRDPVGRELSQIRYLSSFSEQEISVYGKYTWADEMLVRSLQGRGWADVITSDFYLSNYANMQVRCLTGGLPPMSNPRKLGSEDLDAAKSNLMKLSSFGLVGEMERSILVICASLGLPYRPVPLYNVSQGPDLETIDCRLEAAIVAANELDIELYNFARAVFEERASSLESLERAASPASRGGLRARFVKPPVTRANGVQRLRAAVLDASKGMILTGWLPRFFYEPLSRWIRWGGPGRESKLYLPLDRYTERAITAEIPLTRSKAISGGLTVSIDSDPTETQRSYVSIRGSECCLLLQFVVPAAHSRQEAYTEIAFHSPDEADEGQTFAMGRIWVR